MKTGKLLLGLFTATLILAGCASDDTEGITIVNNSGGSSSSDAIEIGGILTTDLTLETGNQYILTSALIVPEGRTLTINPGVVVKALVKSNIYIAVTQGGKIMAEGISTNPIVLTAAASTPNPGDWGGLIVLGKAPINTVSNPTNTSTSELGGLPYGGDSEDDNSGIIKYVRVEYSGEAVDSESENNGFSFYGVGNGTTIEYIQAFEGKDDGVEFFGGTVNASFVSVVGAQDDSVDWTEGYSGTLANVYIEHRQKHDKGIEGDGYNDKIGNNSNPVFWSAPNVNNLTIIGNGSSNLESEAVRLRVGTRVLFENVYISGFAEAFDLVGNGTSSHTGQGVLDDETGVIDITFDDVANNLINNTAETFGEADLFSGIGNGTGADYISWSAGWTRN